MKKIVLLLVIILSACGEVSQINILDSKNNAKRNQDCMDMRRFKVLQVLEDDSALAFECNSGEFCSVNPIVLLAPQRGVDYYDDMLTAVPNKKCAVQNGVYKYETKNNSIKTVPIIIYDYEYVSTSDEEQKERFYETMDDLRYECKRYMSHSKKTNNSKNMEKCDCALDVLTSEFLILAKDSKNVGEEKLGAELNKKIEKKCGVLPKFF